MGIWTKKTIPELLETHDSRHQHLKRTLTTLDLLFIGIGCIIGAGLFSITGVAAAENAGPAIVLSFIIAAIGCGFAGLCYSELASMIPVSGSAYTYAQASMGELPAWIIGWDLILEYAVGAGAVSISWSAYVVSLLADFGIYLPASLVASPWQNIPLNLYGVGDAHAGYINLPAVLIIVALTLLLIRGIRQSATVNSIIVVIKVCVVLIFIGVGVFYINPANYVPFIPENTGQFGQFGWSGILRATSVIFFAYIGFDTISTTALEAKTPQKSIPIGILGALAICTILYIAFSFVLTGLANYKELNVAAPVAVAISKTPYPWLQMLIKLAIIAGLTSVIIVLMLGQSRIFYVMSRDGMLPKYLSKLHPRYQTPWLCNLLLMTLVAFIAAFTPISLVGHMTSIGTLLAFTIVSLGVLILRYKYPEYHRPFRAPLFPLTPILGCITCMGMMIFLDFASWMRLIGWLIVGLFINFAYSRYHSGK